MRALVQRVRSGRVAIEGETHAAIGPGSVVLLGVETGDTDRDAAWIASKLSRLRIFEDDQGRMNEDISRHGNAFLLVSQFTLLGDARRGNRPGFVRAAAPSAAEPMFELVARKLHDAGHQVKTGKFRSHMVVHIENDGPVTLLLDSRENDS